MQAAACDEGDDRCRLEVSDLSVGVEREHRLTIGQKQGHTRTQHICARKPPVEAGPVQSSGHVRGPGMSDDSQSAFLSDHCHEGLSAERVHHALMGGSHHGAQFECFVNLALSRGSLSRS
ncbi:hypothetical protein GCM10010317_064930 [Streptomyces mirabilis]|nr:hypothetical protein GCM10010317_064930 [Streptomyces mirabilis]